MPQLPAGEGQAPMESEPPEEVVERLAHMEQLVVQLKGLIRDKDTQLIQKDTELANKDVQFKVNNLCVCLLSRLYSKRQFTIFFLPTFFMTKQHLFVLLRIHRMRKKSLKLASLNSNCRPKPRWLLSTNR